MSRVLLCIISILLRPDSYCIRHIWQRLSSSVWSKETGNIAPLLSRLRLCCRYKVLNRHQCGYLPTIILFSLTNDHAQLTEIQHFVLLSTLFTFQMQSVACSFRPDLSVMVSLKLQSISVDVKWRIIYYVLSSRSQGERAGRGQPQRGP